MLTLGSCSRGEEPSDGSGPMKIALLVGKAGESSVAIDDFANGVEMAVEKINAEGGISGKEIELKRFASSVQNLSATVQAVTEAVEWKPTVMLGFEAVTQTKASLNQIAQSPAPFITATAANLTASDIQTGGGNIFQLLPSDEEGVYPDSAAIYTAKNLGAKRVGLLYTDLEFSNRAAGAIEDQLVSLGAEVVLKRSYSVDSTDLTAQVLALKNANIDAVINWGYPNQLALQLQQFAQNDMSSIPTVSSAVGTIVANNTLVDTPLMANLHAAAYCNPSGDQPEWSAEYLKAYGGTATSYAAFMYDAVYFAKAAVEEAGTTDPVEVAEAMRTASYLPGVCQREYKSSGDTHVLSDGAVVVSLADGVSRTEKVG